MPTVRRPPRPTAAHAPRHGRPYRTSGRGRNESGGRERAPRRRAGLQAVANPRRRRCPPPTTTAPQHLRSLVLSPPEVRPRFPPFNGGTQVGFEPAPDVGSMAWSHGPSWRIVAFHEASRINWVTLQVLEACKIKSDSVWRNSAVFGTDFSK